MNGEKIQKILGIVTARNEKTLISLTVSHALMNGCSEICILVHNSDQDFKEEVTLLAKLWPNRIHVFYQEEFKYHQAIAVHAIRFLMQNQNYDWIYVFDADEFMVQSEDFNICDFLEGVPSEIQSVRYEIRNWISNYNFELKHYEEFLDIIYVSEPQSISYPNISILKEKIKNNEANFFDLTFPSKIIFRTSAPYVLASGAHYLEGYRENVEISIDSKFFQIAHVPFLTKLRLLLRVEHGENLMLSEYPEVVGWQEKMLFELNRESGLDNFWEFHSTKILEKNSDSGKPFARVDFAFRNTIGPTVKVLNELILNNTFSEVYPLKNIDISSLVNFYKFIFKFNPEYDIVIVQRDIAMAERDHALVERDHVVAERDHVVAERDHVVAERDHALVERDHALVERDHALVERDHALVERDHIQKSTIWKIFRPYRLLKSKLISFR